MADAATSIRGTPDGVVMGDGYQTLITPASNLTISFWEKGVTPPGMDGGDAVDTTTMHNTAYRTFYPRNLKTLTDAGATVAYDAAVYDDIIALINVRTDWTVNFSSGDTLDWYGYLKSFEPGEITEGAQPEATIVIVSTNVDDADETENGPNFKTSAGTD